MLKRILLIGLSFYAVNVYAYDVSEIKINDNIDAVRDKLPTKEIKSEPDREGGKYGFNNHISFIDGHYIRLSTRPDDSIYRIAFYQEFPVKQAESIKESICKKYNFDVKKCWWSKKYEDVPANRTDNLFSQGQRGESEILKVRIDKAMNKRAIKEGYIGITISLEVRKSHKEVARWEKTLRDKENKKAVAATIKSTANAPIEQPRF